MLPASPSIGPTRRAWLVCGLATAAAAAASWREDARFRDVAHVDAAGAKSLIDAGALVIDVREASAWAVRHLPAAISLPLAALEVAVPPMLAALDRRIVVYCGNGKRIGPAGVVALTQAGYAGAVNLRGGIQAWADAGLGVVKA